MFAKLAGGRRKRRLVARPEVPIEASRVWRKGGTPSRASWRVNIGLRIAMRKKLHDICRANTKLAASSASSVKRQIRTVRPR